MVFCPSDTTTPASCPISLATLIIELVITSGAILIMLLFVKKDNLT